MEFSEDMRLKILEEIKSGVHTNISAQAFYNIRGHSTLLKWRRKYGYDSAPKNIRSKTGQAIMKDSNKANKNFGEEYEDQVAILKRKITVLEEQLRHAEMKHIVLDAMIDIADARMGTNIRKKIGPKQSK